MNLPFYVNSRSIRLSPNDRYLQQKQAEINARWENSTQNEFDVTMQASIGSSVFNAVDVSIDSAIDIGTGYKKGDDFKVFSHRNISTNPVTGILYHYADNYWIVTNTSKLASPTSSSEVRRCNNILKWIDSSTGVLKTEPCAIDYELSSPSPQQDKDVTVANGHALVICQGNDQTLAIEKNQRFIINGQPFKLSAINNLHYDDVDVDESTLLYLDVYLDTIANDDDLTTDIANATEYDYTVEISKTPTKQINGFTGTAVATVKLNGEKITRTLTWTGNEYVTMGENGSYTLNGSMGDIAKITVALADNPNVKDTLSIEIVASMTDEDTILMTPNVTQLKQKESVTFTADLYHNGTKQQSQVTCTPSGVSSSRYTLVAGSNNSFTLTNNMVSTTPLTLTFTSGSTTVTKQIKLLSYF